MCLAFAGLLACAPQSIETVDVPTGTFEEFFLIAGTLELRDRPDAPLGEIGLLVEARNGDLIVADAFLPSLKRFDHEGHLIAEFGSYGEGPQEFRYIGGLLEHGDGRVIIVDPRLNRISVVHHDLRTDTVFSLGIRPGGSIAQVHGGYLLATAPGPRRSAFSWLTDEWKPAWDLPSPVPSSVAEIPYWSGFAIPHMAVSSGLLVTGYSYGYPLQLYDTRGRLIDSMGWAPRSFRAIPTVGRGAFSGPSGSERMDRWLRSFDVIADLRVLGDSLLVVTHGEFRFSRATGRVSAEHRRIDIYNLHTRSKIAEDILLPSGSRVLATGRRGVYLLLDQPPNPWRIAYAALFSGAGTGNR
jgi:hypothetical protein